GVSTPGPRGRVPATRRAPTGRQKPIVWVLLPPRRVFRASAPCLRVARGRRPFVLIPALGVCPVGERALDGATRVLLLLRIPPLLLQSLELVPQADRLLRGPVQLLLQDPVLVPQPIEFGALHRPGFPDARPGQLLAQPADLGLGLAQGLA